ncbi:MAG: hypothetical protein ACREPN_07650 [Rudaea sp.]
MRAMKLAVRLREYDWTAAIIELVIVVVGILIALQVSNWNQARLDRGRAESYYRRIHAELLEDRQNIDLTLAYWKTVATYGRAAMAYGETGQLADGSNWKTILAYYQSSQIQPFELVDTTFTEMRSAGDLDLIANENLRKDLAGYYRLSGSGITSMILHHDPVYRKQVRGLTPWHVQEHIWNDCFHETSNTQEELLDCPSPISERDAAGILDTFRQTPTLLTNLRTWMATLRVSEIVLDNTRMTTNKLIADVDAAQKR